MSKLNAISLKQNRQNGEGEVSFLSEYRRMHDVEKLDFLKDCIFELTCEYNKQLEATFGEKALAKKVRK